MTQADERREKVESVKSQLAELAGVDAQSLARTSDLSPDINFKEAVPSFEEMLDLFRQLNQRDISRLTSQQLGAIAQACGKVEALIKQVREFDLNQDKPGDVCKGLINTVQNTYDAVMTHLLLPLAFTATQATDYARIEREAKGYHATMKDEADKFRNFMNTAKGEIDKALAAVKEQAADAGVSSQAQIFLKDAETHHRLAGRWMNATIVMAALTFASAVAALVVAIQYQPADTAAAIQYVVAKIIVLSVLSFGIIWCARNYKAQKHNETLNKHRANALMTFRAFVEGSSDDRVKDAILLQAAQAAFSGRQTGFDTEDRDTQTINPVVEVIGRTLTRGDGTG